MKGESEVIKVALYHVGDIGLQRTDHVSRVLLDPVTWTLTRLNMP